MSVSMHLSVTVRGFDPARAAAVRAAVADLLAREELTADFGPLVAGEDAGGRFLRAATDPDSPVIISRSFEWVPRMERDLADAVAAANGGPCHTEFGGDYLPDEAAAEDEEWGDD